MAYKFSTEGGYGIGVSAFHYDALHADHVDIPDAELLFRGHFARSGPDLILTSQDGQRHIVPGYFATENHADLFAPNGAHLSADVVDLLAGSPTPGQYAQAHTAVPPEAIGKVEKVVGSVTLLHNGVSEPLHVGDAVFKSDVVETGANSSAGIAFPDGTALDLVADTRMALNEYSFDAAGTANGALFSLVEGTFAFVAGQVAHSGEGMKINTPVATMGIRGTVGLFRSEPTVINANLGHVWSVFLHEDLDGSHHLGRIALIDQDPTSPTFGQVIYLLDTSDSVAHLEPRGPGLPPLVRLEPITDSKISGDRHFYDDLTQILNAYNNANAQPNGATGSGDNPNQLFTPPQNFEENGGGLPLLINLNRAGGSDSGPTLNVEVPVQPAGISPQSSSQSTLDIFIWTAASGGPFGTGPDWNLGSVPGSTATVDIFVVNGAPVTVTIDAPEIINNLTIGPGVTLSIIAPGSLTVLTNLVDSGFIQVGAPGGWDPSLSLTGPISINSGGRIEANTAANIDFHDVQIISAGTIEAVNGGIIFLSDGTTFNGGTLATDSISIVEIQSGPDGSGATLGDVALGGNLQVDRNAALTLQGTVNSQATIHVAANAFLFLDAAAVLNGGTVALAGGTINGSGDLAPTDLTGYGTVNLPFNSPDTVRADGGTLEFTNVVDSSAATAFEIGSAANSVLKFDSAVGTATTSPTITFEGGDDGHGVVDLTKISLSDFHGVIANFDEGESIDVAGATGVALEANGTTLDVYDGAKLLGTLTFSVSYAGDIFSVSNDVITVDDLVATFDAATVPGQSAQGAALTVTGVADNHTDVSESVTYAWRLYDTETNSWTTVGTGSSYTPSESDEDHQLQLLVTYANDPSGSQSTTYNFGTVQEIAGDDTVVSIGGLSDGNAVEGTPVTATITDGGLAVSGATYQWQLNGKDIVGATSAIFTPTEINEGQALTINVTFTDAAGNNETGSGTAGIVQDAAPEGPALGGATSATVGEGAIILLGVTDGRVDSDDSLGVVTITGLPHDLTDVSGGSYDSDDGTWTGTAAQFNALSFAAGEDGTFHLTISANTAGAEAATTTESYTLTVFENAEDEWNNSSGGAWSTAWNWTVEDGGQHR